MNHAILSLCAMLLISSAWSQANKPDYIQGYACPDFAFDKNGDTTACYWVQYIGVSEINKHVHDYRIYNPDSTWEDNQFVTFDSHEVDPRNTEYKFQYLSSTLPDIIINGVSTEVIGAYPLLYPKCHFNNFQSSSHKVLTIEKDGGADYPCVLHYEKEDNEVSILLRKSGGIAQIKFSPPASVGNSSKEIIAIDFKHNKILFENHNDWIEFKSVETH